MAARGRDAKERALPAVQRRERVSALPIRPRAPIVVAGPTGIVPLSSLSVDRSSFLLVGPPGVGKSVGAVTFGGGEYGRILYMLVEHGQEGGAGGATPLKYLADVTGVREEEIDVLPVTSWNHAQTQYRWIVDHVRELFEERKIRTLVIDGVTEISAMIEEALGGINPAQIGVTDSNQRSLVNDLVKDIDGRAGRQLEKADFGRMLRLVRGFVGRSKLLPFRVVATALEGDMYGDTRQGPESLPIGIGPDVPGRKLVGRLCAQFDFVFHCERQAHRDRTPDGKPLPARISYVWLTSNDPRLSGNTNGYFAKTRAGYSLDRFVAANGRNVLTALGYKPVAADAPLPAGPSVADVRAVDAEDA